jgi:hypothetical protein
MRNKAITERQIIGRTTLIIFHSYEPIPNIVSGIGFGVWVGTN